MPTRAKLALLALVTAALAACTSTISGRRVPETSARSTPVPAATAAAFNDPSTVAQILSDTSRDLVDLNTYDYRNIDDLLSRGTAASTGTFQRRFRQTVTMVVRPSAPGVRQVQKAMVLATGLASRTSASEATVLAFGQLSVTNTTTTTPRKDAFASTVTVRKVGSRWLVADLEVSSSLTCDPPGTRALQTACSRAGEGAAALASYTRAGFDADYERALAFTTGTLRTQVSGLRDTTRRTLTAGRFDLSAKVVASAVSSVSGDSVVVVVKLNGYRSNSRSTPNSQSLKVTVVRVGGRWLLSDVTSVVAR